MPFLASVNHSDGPNRQSDGTVSQYLTRAAASNIVHCELFFDPQAHTSRGVPFPTIVTGYNNALQLELKLVYEICINEVS